MPITMRMAMPRMASIPESRDGVAADAARSGVRQVESFAIKFIDRKPRYRLSRLSPRRTGIAGRWSGKPRDQADDGVPVGSRQCVPAPQVLRRQCDIAGPPLGAV